MLLGFSYMPFILFLHAQSSKRTFLSFVFPDKSLLTPDDTIKTTTMPDNISKSDLDALVKIASTSHTFRAPVINAAGATSFERSFKSVGSHPSTIELMRKVI